MGVRGVLLLLVGLLIASPAPGTSVGVTFWCFGDEDWHWVRLEPGALRHREALESMSSEDVAARVGSGDLGERVMAMQVLLNRSARGPAVVDALAKVLAGSRRQEALSQTARVVPEGETILVDESTLELADPLLSPQGSAAALIGYLSPSDRVAERLCAQVLQRSEVELRRAAMLGLEMCLTGYWQEFAWEEGGEASLEMEIPDIPATLLLLALRDREPGVFLRAACILQQRPTPLPGAVPILRAALEGPESEMRGAALLSLEAVQAPPELLAEAGLRALHDHDSNVRGAAVQVLRSIPAPLVLDQLRSILEQGGREARLVAAQVLGGYRDDGASAAPELLRLLCRGDEELQAVAVAALRMMPAAAPVSLEPLVDALGRIDCGGAAVAVAVRDLGRARSDIAESVMRRRPDVIRRFVELIASDDQRVVEAARVMLMAASPPRVVEELRGGLEDDLIRKEGVSLAGALGDEAVGLVPDLIRWAQYDSDLAEDVVRSLGSIPAAFSTTRPFLLDSLMDGEPPVSCAAAEVLVWLDAEPRDLVPRLVARLADARAVDAGCYLEALSRLGPAAEAAQVEVENRLDSPLLREQAVSATLALGGEEVILRRLWDPEPKLRELCADALFGESMSSPEAVEALRLLLVHGDVRERTRAAYRLGQLGSRSEGALEDLRRALLDPEESVRYWADLSVAMVEADLSR